MVVEEINLLSNPALRDEDREEKNFLRSSPAFLLNKNLVND